MMPFSQQGARAALREVREAKVISTGMSDRLADQMEGALDRIARLGVQTSGLIAIEAIMLIRLTPKK